MLRLQPKGPDLWDSILPDELRKLPQELEHVNELLSDDKLMEPFVKRFSTHIGRPTVPVATYIRLMYLKFRYKLGYETLVSEVSDSIAWRRFCSIGYEERVPDSTTLIKLTHKYGQEVLRELHTLIIENLKRRKIVRGRKIRVDTTVVSSDIHYPTDTSLLGDGLRRLRDQIAKVKGTGLRLARTLGRVKKLNFSCAQLLRKKDSRSRKKVRAINRTVIHIVQKTTEKVKNVFASIKDKRIQKYVSQTLKLISKVASQSQERLKGNKPEDRVVSFADPDARPIVKGRLDKPVEFGRVAQVTQDESGYITGYGVYQGNPSDVTMLPEIVKQHQEQFDKQLNSIAADTGFASDDNFSILKKLGIKRIGIPCRGKPPPSRQRKQKRNWFRSLRRFRAGIEALFRFLDRKFGFKRSMYRGNTGTFIWASWVVISANLYRFSHGP